MTKKNEDNRLPFASLVLVLLVLAGGCSYTVKPAQVPSMAGGPAISLAGTSVLVVNGEKNSADAGVESGLRANRQEWSRKVVESLAGELARRGAQVRANAKLVLTVSLPEIVFADDRDGSRFLVKAQVSSSTGWSKTYEGTGKGERLSAPAEADRLAARALADLVRAMITDSEFQAQLIRK